MRDTKTKDEELIRFSYSGYLKRKFIGTTFQVFSRKVYDNFIVQLSLHEQILIFKFLFYLGYKKHIDTIKNMKIEVTMCPKT